MIDPDIYIFFSEKYVLYQQWPREKTPRLPLLKTHTLTPTDRRSVFCKEKSNYTVLLYPSQGRWLTSVWECLSFFQINTKPSHVVIYIETPLIRKLVTQIVSDPIGLTLRENLSIILPKLFALKLRGSGSSTVQCYGF